MITLRCACGRDVIFPNYPMSARCQCGRAYHAWRDTWTGAYTIDLTVPTERRYEATGSSISLVEDGQRYGQFEVKLVGATTRLTKRIADALNEYDARHPIAASKSEGT